jgi:membrane-associated phospholipid phosphatase
VNRSVGVTVVSLALFVATAVRATGDQAPSLDTRILEHVPPGDTPNTLSHLCNAFVVAGMAFVIIAASAMGIALLVRKAWRPALFWCLTFAGVLAFDLALKPLFGRPSLHSPGEDSFPSGHAMASMAFFVGATSLIRGLPRWLYAVGAVVVAAYGGALVYLSWHYPTDVVGGWLLTVAWMGLLSLIIRPPAVFEARRLGFRRANRATGASRLSGSP